MDTRRSVSRSGGSGGDSSRSGRRQAEILPGVKKGSKAVSCCDTCAYYAFDEEYEEYCCTQNLDEDELYRLNFSGEGCPYYRSGDEYSIVRKQN